MNLNNTVKQYPSIWLLGLGYFLSYIPYSAMTKALSKGLLSESSGTISGFELLPTVVLGTVLGFLAILTLMGWWKYAGRISVGGLSIPFATNKWTFFSGVATAGIIMTTTLAYTMEGISIVFAALLMRGGVLLMAPMWDTVFKRKVHWYSWAAFGLSLLALWVLFSEKGGYTLTLIAILNIGVYLSSYFFRLHFMTKVAKTDSFEASYTYFVEEMLVAMAVILFAPCILAGIGQGSMMLSLRAGYTDFMMGSLALPALIIGIFYAFLYIFGTRIYLDKRENTFCIPINRCASLLAGVVASLLLGVIFQSSFVSATQLGSAAILIGAICFLAYPAFFTKKLVAFRCYLFVCNHNTTRSPIAAAICLDMYKQLLQGKGLTFSHNQVMVWSAGVQVEQEAPITELAKITLEHMQITPLKHMSTILTETDMGAADKIWCMSKQVYDELLDMYPEAEDTLEYLSIPNPTGLGLASHITFATQLKGILHDKLNNDIELQLA